MIKTIAKGLGNLLSEVVFVGGSVAELYASNVEAIDEIRMTEDVDVVVEIDSLHTLHSLEDKLRALGFKNDFSEGAPICRWIFNDVKLDVMPNESSVLGFSNRWYTPGIKNKIESKVDNTTNIYIFNVVYYLASKFEAIKSRGATDIRLSHDFEDVVFIFDNCDFIESELEKSTPDLILYFKDYLNTLANDRCFDEAVACSLPFGFEDRAKEIIERIKNII
jgi:hypothetical protein